MASNMLLIGAILLLSMNVHADLAEHTFVVHNKIEWRACRSQEITVVNNSFPGPTIDVHEGDSVAINVINNSPHDMSIHWHGVFQLFSNWADGPGYITQCPIRPGNNFTYRFNVTGQEGTLFWHAHTGWHRATVHGAFVIRPKKGNSYPFPKPYGEFPIIIGEWHNTSIVDLEQQLLLIGNGPNYSQGLTINGWLGDFYPCSSSSRRRFLPEEHQSTIELPTDEGGLILDDIYRLKVKSDKTYMVRIICTTLNIHAFFKIARHTMTVVAIDAVYTTPYVTDLVVLAPGQTVDVLLTTNQKPSSYYMASRYYNPLYRPTTKPAFSVRDYRPQTSILIYEDSSISDLSAPLLPKFPDLLDFSTPFKFLSSLKGLENGPHWSPVPLQVDEYMYLTTGMGISDCLQEDRYNNCQGPGYSIMAASFNNASFQLPSNISILEAYYNNISGVYTNDFPNNPPKKFDYTNVDYFLDFSLLWVEKGTKVKKLKYNSTVQIVFQNTVLIAPESHPIHLHGFNFYVLAQGFGNFNPLKDREMFNLVNPQMRNTIDIPINGWAAIRFRANNPGVWYMHCHLEFHVSFGLAAVFIVEDGPTPQMTLSPPPTGFPRC